jgi:hypothetical protein
MEVGMTLLKMFQEPHYDLASRREDGKTNQDKENSLHKREE